MLGEEATLYDILELNPDASPQEIRAAYVRVKAAYNKDSVALYSLISKDETESFLRKIEEAYQVLSNPERRKEYDRRFGRLQVDEEPVRPSRTHQKIISIDRVPPMESRGTSDLLVPPVTDFNAATALAPQSDPLVTQPKAPVPAPALAAVPNPVPVAPPMDPFAAPSGPDPLDEEIARETDWSGTFLKKVRDARRISVEEMADTTKISKSYLLAIEAENFAKLPAAVFVRGFLVQVSRVLKLPGEKVAVAFLQRYYRARPDRERI